MRRASHALPQHPATLSFQSFFPTRSITRRRPGHLRQRRAATATSFLIPRRRLPFRRASPASPILEDSTRRATGRAFCPLGACPAFPGDSVSSFPPHTVNIPSFSAFIASFLVSTSTRSPQNASELLIAKRRTRPLRTCCESSLDRGCAPDRTIHNGPAHCADQLITRCVSSTWVSSSALTNLSTAFWPFSLSLCGLVVHHGLQYGMTSWFPPPISHVNLTLFRL